MRQVKYNYIMKKYLLIQIRKDQKIKDQELKNFSTYSKISLSEFEILDVFANPNLTDVRPEEYEAIFVGGASDASVLNPQKYTFVKPSEKFLLKALELNVPVFASCFGFQLALQALGANVIKDGKDFEMGTLEISLSTQAETDPVFKNTPNPFMAVTVHQEMVTELPEICERLAYTDRCIHAFKVKGKRFWGFQFHPEVDKKSLVERLTFYKDQYTEDDSHLDEIINAACETPDSHRLIENFAREILGVNQ